MLDKISKFVDEFHPDNLSLDELVQAISDLPIQLAIHTPEDSDVPDAACLFAYLSDHRAIVLLGSWGDMEYTSDILSDYDTSYIVDFSNVNAGWSAFGSGSAHIMEPDCVRPSFAHAYWLFKAVYAGKDSVDIEKLGEEAAVMLAALDL